MKHSAQRHKQITSKTGQCRGTTQSRFMLTAAAMFSIYKIAPQRKYVIHNNVINRQTKSKGRLQNDEIV